VAEKYEFEKLPVVCEEPVPTIAVDGYWGVITKDNSVRVNLVEERFDPGSDRVYKYVVARLFMPIDSFLGMVDGLSALAQRIRSERKQ
jgi:hypothetical protein